MSSGTWLSPTPGISEKPLVRAGDRGRRVGWFVDIQVNTARPPWPKSVSVEWRTPPPLGDERRRLAAGDDRRQQQRCAVDGAPTWQQRDGGADQQQEDERDTRDLRAEGQFALLFATQARQAQRRHRQVSWRSAPASRRPRRRSLTLDSQ